MIRAAWRFLTLCLLLFAALPAAAAEYIASYHSVVELARDSSMRVTETITANTEGTDIKRGIFRDFPLYATDANGRRIKVDFNVVSMERDGAPEQWRTENVAGGVRIYAGSADVLLNPGEHTWQITYETGRQIRYFENYDELFWNVTGNGWMFRIAEASATVVLPDGVKPLETVFYTGEAGSRDRNARVTVEGNEVFFATSKPLGAHEGLTIGVKFGKGAIAAPSSDKESAWWLRDNLGLLIAVGGLALIFLYYFRSWSAVGRDPAAGVMVPRWDPPEGLSPALVNYVDNKGFSGAGWDALSATALDLAVKGYVVLEDLKKAIVIRRTDKSADPGLPAGQRSLLSSIGGAGQSLTIDKKNGAAVEAAGANFRQAIEKEHRGKYYLSNIGYTIGGVVMSVLALVGILVFADLDETSVAILIVPMFCAVFIAIFAINIGKALRRGRSLIRRIGLIIVLSFMTMVVLTILAGVVSEIILDAEQGLPLIILFCAGGIVLVNLLFIFLMGAPTPLGRKLMDGIEGLRTYLTLAEKDRMNMQGAPEMSPSHFEKLLPYAVALGVEKPWSKAFETWLAAAAAGAAAAAYTPGWYVGDSRGSFGDRIGGFSSSMSSTIASTIPQPVASQSSSGFSGGGSSGGGGGGGGGGGW